MRRAVPTLFISLGIAAAVGLGLWLGDKQSNRVERVMDVTGAPRMPIVTGVRLARLEAETTALRAWFSSEAPEFRKEEWVGQGVSLAQQRRESMSRLMRLDSRAALRQALRWDEWEQLPPQVRAHVERPISEWVRLDSYVGCDPERGIGSSELRIIRQDGTDLRAYSHGRRQMSQSRAGVPVQGFILGEESALEEDAVKLVSGAEAVAASRALPVLAAGLKRSLWSGRTVTSAEAVTVLIGGRVGRVPPQDLPAVRARLHAWEELPGEKAGVEVLAAWLEEDDPGEFTPMSEAVAAPAEANPWTTSPKKVLLMRVDFPNLTGGREEPATLLTKLNNDVSPVLEEMSYGKTELIVTVIPEVIRMPQVSSYYPAEQEAGRNGNGQMQESAQAGAEALGYAMDDYDFLCVQFKDIGMGYGGLALVGGQRSWIQSSGTSIFVHEFGHNYGVGHASRWQPDPVGGPLGANGTSIEYGSGSSMMGGGPFPTGHFDAQAKVVLNWLDGSQWRDVTTSGRYRLWRADEANSPGAGAYGALRIGRAGVPEEALWLSYKRSLPNRRRLERGVSVLWERAGMPRRNWLIRAGREGSFDEDDYELPVGNTFSDGAVHITPVERGGTPPRLWVDVEVQLGPAPGNANPTALWSRAPTAGQPQETLRFEVQAGDPNGDELAYHWDMGDGREVSYNGASLVHAYDAPGVYSVSVEISDMRGGRIILNHAIDVAAEAAVWTQRTSGTTSQLNGVAASATRAVAVSGSGHVVHSGDGLQWTLHDLKAAQGVNALDLREVLSDGQSFIAAGRERAASGGLWEGCIYRSTDGVSWTPVHLGGEQLLRVAQGGGLWVVTGENSTMWSSEDGVLWTSVSFPSSDHIQGIAYGNGRWLAMADRNSERTWAFTATTPGFWTEQSWAEAFTDNQIVRPVRSMDGEFYLGGFAVGLRTVSGNAQTLDAEPLLTGLSVNDMMAVGSSRYVVGDLSDSGVTQGHVHLSVSGQSWQRLDVSGAGILRGIALFGGRVLAVGSGGEIWQSGFLVPAAADGWRTWQLANQAVLGSEDDPMQFLPGAAFPNVFYYALGLAPGMAVATQDLPFGQWDAGGGLRLVVPRRSLRPDIGYRVLRSTDLQHWSEDGIEILADGPDRLEARSFTPGVDARGFLRLNVELAP